MPLTASDLTRQFLKAAVLTFSLGIALFALVRLQAIATFDERATAAIHQFAIGHQPVRQTTEALTMVGNPLVLTTLVVAVAATLIRAHRPRVAVRLLVVTAGGATIETGLKLLIRRTRPDLENVLLQARGTSFPSGHAMNTAIVLGAIALALSHATSLPPRITKTVLAVAATISILVAATRVLAGVHYLSDVASGLVLGLLWIGICHRIATQRCAPAPSLTRGDSDNAVSGKCPDDRVTGGRRVASHDADD